MNTFKECLNKGHEAEALFKQRFEQKGYTVKDVTKDTEY